VKCPPQISGIKLRGDVEKRAAAVVGLQHVEGRDDFFDEIDDLRTGAAGAHILEVQYWGQRIGFAWHKPNEVPDLVGARPALLKEVVGSARQSGVPCAIPVRVEALVAKVSPLGRLEVCEANVRASQDRPVDVALMIGDERLCGIKRPIYQRRALLLGLAALAGRRPRSRRTTSAPTRRGDRLGLRRGLRRIIGKEIWAGRSITKRLTGSNRCM
jgi:hypothetical protein